MVFPASLLRGAGALWFARQPHPGDGGREINDEDVVINERTHAGLQDFRGWVAARLDPARPEI